MDELRGDIRQAVRSLRRDARFSVLAVLTLAIGIGANAAVFTIVHGVLLTPPPYPAPDRLVVLWSEVPSAGIREATSAYANVMDWRTRSSVLDDVAVFDPIILTTLDARVPTRVEGARISETLFDVLGAGPEVGRAFTREEVESRATLALASHAFASARFGNAAAAVGRSVVLDGTTFQLIGVMPAGFDFPDADTQLWVPRTSFAGGEEETVRRGTGAWRAIGRLRGGVDLDDARADLHAAASALGQEHAENAGLGVRIVPLQEQRAGTSARTSLWTLYGAVAVLLLIACANAAHLFLVRGMERSGDRAIRTALGASRVRLVRQALAESGVVALLGGFGGAGLAIGGVELFGRVAPPDMLRVDLRIGFVTFAYVAGLAAVIAVVFGVLPTQWRARHGIDWAGARVLSAPGGRPRRGRNALIAAQLALALVLVFSASLLVRSLVASSSVDPGFDSANVLMANLSVASPEARVGFYRSAVERVSTIPGVQAAGIIEDVFIGGAPSREVEVEDGSGVTAGRTSLRIDAVGGDVFAAIGAPLVAGRFFTSADDAGAPVAIVNQTLARRLWAGRSPIGRRFRAGANEPWLEVVGVVGDMRRQGSELQPIAQAFRPHAQAPSRNMNLLVRSELPADALAALVRERIAEADRTIPLYGVTTLSAGMDRYVAPRRLQTLLLGLFSAVALIMAAVGLYGLLHYSVSRRAREIGVRVALGARPADVARMVVGEGVMLALPGLAIGVLGAVWAADWLEALLYAVGPSDPASLLVTVVTLTAVTLLASYLPARRAASVEPTRAIRGE